MKKTVKEATVLLIGSFMIALLFACDRFNGVEPELKDKIFVLLEPDAEYEYNTGIGGDEDGAIIRKQAENYEVSEIVRDSTTNWVAVYRYKPKADFIGQDYVEIETHQGSDGASPPTKIEIIRIEFIVID